MRSAGFRFWIFTVVFAGWILVLRLFVLEIRIVQGHSMEPSLTNGDVLFLWKRTVLSLVDAQFQRGDIVVYESPFGVSVKRVIGLPQDMYEFRSGHVWIGGKQLEESYLHSQVRTNFNPGEAAVRPKPGFFSIKEVGRIPDQYYLLLGDNRPYSTDSRQFGLVSEKRILGIAEVIFR